MPEPFVITCPECGKSFKGKPEFAGKRVKCPACAKPFQVPAAKTPVAVPVQTPAEEPAKNRFDDEDDDPNPYGVTTLDIAPRCPNCAQLMESKEAFICKYCGYNTLTRELGKTIVTVSHSTGERIKHLLPGILAFTFIILQTMFMIYYCVVVPVIAAPNSWLSYFNAESLRLWSVAFGLFNIWPIGYFVFKRFVLQPSPPEKIIE